MGLISIPTISDGTVIDANDVNNPLNTIVNEINGSISYDNLADSAVTTDKLSDGATTTAKVANGAITTAKFKPSYFEYKEPVGSNYTTTSTSVVDVGVSTTYTAGATNETLFITVDILYYKASAGSMYVYLNVDGTQLEGGLYADTGNSWMQGSRSWFVNVNAGQTVTIKLTWASNGGGTNNISRSASVHTPHIKGWSFYRD